MLCTITTPRFGMVLLLVLVQVMATGSAIAANDKKDGNVQTKRLQQKINALEQQSSQLSQAKSELEGELNHAKQSAETANRKAVSLDKTLKAAEDDKAELAGKLTQSEQKLTETADTLRLTMEAKNQLEASLSERTQELSACSTKNESLHRVGIDLIKQYKEKSCLNSLLQNEPLTQLKGAEAENMLEEYREKLDQELVNQQPAGCQNPAQQKADVQNAVQQQKADIQKVEQNNIEQKKTESLKVGQQSSLDRITRKVEKFFEQLEW